MPTDLNTEIKASRENTNFRNSAGHQRHEGRCEEPDSKIVIIAQASSRSFEKNPPQCRESSDGWKDGRMEGWIGLSPAISFCISLPVSQALDDEFVGDVLKHAVQESAPGHR
jgi:hypothetical protein